jgi:hypothetical protein
MPRPARPLAALVPFVLASFLLVVEAGPASALPATKPDVTAGVNGTVYAVLQASGRIYVGGKFSWAGPFTGNGAAVLASDGARLSSTARPNGPVRAAVPDGNGGWYIGGDFTKVGLATRLGVARINALGALAGWNPRVAGSVRSMAVGTDGTIYFGGSFSSVGGQGARQSGRRQRLRDDAPVGSVGRRPGRGNRLHRLACARRWSVRIGRGSFAAELASLDPVTGLADGWDPGADGTVEDLALSSDGTRVLVAGSFAEAGGIARDGLAALDAGLAPPRTGTPAPTDRFRRSRYRPMAPASTRADLSRRSAEPRERTLRPWTRRVASTPASTSPPTARSSRSSSQRTALVSSRRVTSRRSPGPRGFVPLHSIRRRPRPTRGTRVSTPPGVPSRSPAPRSTSAAISRC